MDPSGRVSRLGDDAINAALSIVAMGGYDAMKFLDMFPGAKADIEDTDDEEDTARGDAGAADE